MVAWERCRSGRGGEAALGPVAVSGKGGGGGVGEGCGGGKKENEGGRRNEGEGWRGGLSCRGSVG